MCYYMDGVRDQKLVEVDGELVAFTKPVIGLVIAKCVSCTDSSGLWEPIGEFDIGEPR